MTREEAAYKLGDLALRLTNDLYDSYVEPLAMAIKALQELEQKKGKWIESTRRIGTKFHPDCPDFYSVFVCTHCLKENDRTEKYCPHCGAKMEAEE